MDNQNNDETMRNVQECIGRVFACLNHANIEFNNAIKYLEDAGILTVPVPRPLLNTQLLDEQLGAAPPAGVSHRPLEPMIEVNGRVLTHVMLEDDESLAALVETTQDRAQQESERAMAVSDKAVAEYHARMSIQKPADLIHVMAHAVITVKAVLSPGITTSKSVEVNAGDEITVLPEGGVWIKRPDCTVTYEGTSSNTRILEELMVYYDQASTARATEQDTADKGEKRLEFGLGSCLDLRDVLAEPIVAGSHTLHAIRSLEQAVGMSNYEAARIIAENRNEPDPEVLREVEEAGGTEHLNHTLDDVAVPADEPAERVPAPFEKLMLEYATSTGTDMLRQYLTDKVIEGGQGHYCTMPSPVKPYLGQYPDDILRIGSKQTIGWPNGFYMDYKTKENQLFIRAGYFSFVILGLPSGQVTILYAVVRNGEITPFQHVNEADQSDAEMAFIQLREILDSMNYSCKPQQ